MKVKVIWLAQKRKRYYDKRGNRVKKELRVNPAKGGTFKKKSKKIWLAVVICIIGILLGGCGMEENVKINSNLSSKINDKIYVTKWEEAEIEKELVNMGYGSFEAAMKTMGYK